MFDESRKVLDFDEMMELYNKIDNFDYVDEVIDNNTTTRTFNYKLNIVNSFVKKGARNFRGTVFNLNTKELIALPFFKFFNYNENIMTKDTLVNKWTIKNDYEKIDGSLIYFYKVNNKLFARTQRSCTNKQSIKALSIVNSDDDLKDYIEDLIDNNYTPLFELVAPSIDPHVITYDNEFLTFLGIRNMKTGQLIMSNSDILPYKKYIDKLVTILPLKASNYLKIEDYVNECKYHVEDNRKDLLEGFVIEFTNGELVKIKYRQYITIHKMYDEIINDIKIVNRIFNNTLDDMMSEINYNNIDSSYVNNIIKCVDDTWNRNEKIGKEFYNKYKELSKYDYYLKTKEELNEDQKYFALSFYNNKTDTSKLLNSYIANRKWRQSKYYNK